jgi:fatty acid desaturase
MKTDAILRELHQIRRQIEQRCGNNGQTYYEHLLEVQQAYASRLVRRQPTPRLSVPPTSSFHSS